VFVQLTTVKAMNKSKHSLKKNKNFSSVDHVDNIKKYGKIIFKNMLQIYPRQFKFSDNIDGYLDGFFISILKKEKNN
jgi:hypothetical protein